MRRMLNTIYVTTEDAWLRKDGANLVVEVEGVERGRAPLHMLEGVVAFGRSGASPALMAACAEAGIALSYVEPNGRFLARVEGRRSGNVLRRALRDHADAMTEAQRDALAAAERRLTDVARRGTVTGDVDGLRGLEGEAAQSYFGCFDALVRVEGPAFRFAGRSRRPPLDRINALLSFLYALLGHDCRSALEAHGLDPQVGFLHADRPGRASLALDLMEELRPVLADRLALSLVNRRQVSAEDFVLEEAGGVRLTDEARKRVLVAWQERKRDELRHPYLGEAVMLGVVPFLQAQLLARHLRGDLDGYPPFVWK